MKVDKERLVRNVVALRLIELDGGPEAVADVREDLERLIGRTVSRALAARVLGISQTALDRHIDHASVAVVETPAGRREVPLSELVSLVVERRRHRDARHPVAAVLDERRARAMRLTAARLLPERPGRVAGHRPAELRSLAFHAAVAARLDPQLVRDARRRLLRWMADRHIDARWAEQWATLLDQPLHGIRRAIVADDDEAAALRQSSPFAGSLNEPERRRVVDVVRQTA